MKNNEKQERLDDLYRLIGSSVFVLFRLTGIIGGILYLWNLIFG